MKRCVILNDVPFPETKPEPDLAAVLRSSINQLSVNFYDPAQGRVNYDLMRFSEEFRQYVANAGFLNRFDLFRLTGRSDRLAFWINIYNALVVHGIIQFCVRVTIREVSRFFSRFCYLIDGLSFTPDDIEHGILRGNQRSPYRLFRQFSSSDPRCRHIISPADPRIHFTLVCGSISCPPINYYTAENIDQQMDLAASGFINGPEVEILPDRSLLRLSPIFRWYSGDFGGRKGIIELIIRYRESEQDRDFLHKHGMKAEIEWKDYIWVLND